MKNKYLFVLLLVPTAFLNITRTDAQDYFPVMDSISEMNLNKTINVFNDSISEEQKIQILSREEYHNKISSFSNKWYSKHLKAMKEPVLYSDTTAVETIRFTWLRTFHNPVVIGVVHNESGISLYWKKTNGKGGYDPGKTVTNRKTRMNMQQWNELVQQLEKISFWELTTNYPSFGYDGAQWILEAKIGGKYHFVDRWSGDESKIGAFCLSLLSKTKLKIKKKEIY